MNFSEYQSLCHSVFPHLPGWQWEKDEVETYARMVVYCVKEVKVEGLDDYGRMDFASLCTVTLDQLRNWIVVKKSLWE